MKWLMEVEVEGYIEISFNYNFFYKLHFFLNSCIMSEEAFLIYLQNNNQARWAKKIPCNKKDWMLWEGITLNLEIWSNCNWSVHFMNYSEKLLQGTHDDEWRELKKAQTSCREKFAYALHFFVLCFFVVSCYWKENLTNRYAMKKARLVLQKKYPTLFSFLLFS